MFHNTTQHDWQLNEKIENWQLQNGNAKLMSRRAAAQKQSSDSVFSVFILVEKKK